MKKLLISHTAMPNEGEWIPKPDVFHFRYLDWCTRYIFWQQYIKNHWRGKEQQQTGWQITLNTIKSA